VVNFINFCRVFLSVSTGAKNIKIDEKNQSYNQKQSGTFLWFTVYVCENKAKAMDSVRRS